MRYLSGGNTLKGQTCSRTRGVKTRVKTRDRHDSGQTAQQEGQTKHKTRPLISSGDSIIPRPLPMPAQTLGCARAHTSSQSE